MDTSSTVEEETSSASSTTPSLSNNMNSISSVDALVATYQQVLEEITTNSKAQAAQKAALSWSQAAGKFLSKLQTKPQWTQALNAVLVLPPDVLDKNKEQLLQGYCPLQLYLRFTLFQQHKDNDNLEEVYLEIYETLYPKKKTKTKKKHKTKTKKKKSKEESSSQRPLSTANKLNFQDCLVKDCVALLTRAALALSADVPFATYLEGLVVPKDSSTSNQQQLLWNLLFQAFEVPNPYHRTKKRSLMDEDQFPLPKSTSENPKKKRKKQSSTTKINSKTIKPRLQPKNKNRLLALRNTHFHARSAHNLVQMLDRKPQKPALSKPKVKTTPSENERRSISPVVSTNPAAASTQTTPANSSILHSKNKNPPRVVTTEHSKQKKALSTATAAAPQPQRRLMVSKKTKTKPTSTQQHQNLLLSSPLPQFPAGRRRTSVVAETPSHPHHHHVHWGTSTTATTASTTSTAAAGMQQSVVAETPLPQTSSSKRRTSSAASFLQPMNLFED